jgi:hypothetical protein
MAGRVDNRATLERQTAAYFNGMTSRVAAEEADLASALSGASGEWYVTQSWMLRVELKKHLRSKRPQPGG